MNKVTVRINGMMCNMCEEHISEAIKNAFGADSVTASHKKGEAVFETDKEISKDEMEKVIGETGYKFKSMSVSKVRSGQGGKKGLFASLFGK